MSDTAPSHQLNLRKPYLKLIADGIKTVEVRVGYPKMRRIHAGHELTFVSGGDTVVTRVTLATVWDKRRSSAGPTVSAWLNPDGRCYEVGASGWGGGVSEPQEPSQRVLYIITCATPAAHDIGKLVTLAQASGWKPFVITTPSALRFIDRAALEAQTGYPVRSEYKQPGSPDVLPPARHRRRRR